MAFKRVLSVSDLNGYIKGVFDDEMVLHNLTVFGEVEEMKVVGSTTYLTLRDEISRLSCVMFSAHAPFQKGAAVELDGGIRFYQKAGKVSFIARDIRLRGESARHAAFLRLKDTLEREGVFANKKTIPQKISTIAVVTSETGAVLHDFTSVLRSASITADIAVFAVRVQGKTAEHEIALAAKAVAAYQKADVCVFMRGGGAEGDLEPFNTESAARAVAACPVFTISAVGHETDTSLCDLAADVRAGTPSIAAAILKEQILSTRAHVLQLGKSLQDCTDRMLQRQNARLSHHTSAVSSLCAQRIALGIQKTRFLSQRMEISLQKTAQAQSTRLQKTAQRLVALAMQHPQAADARLKTAAVLLDAQSPLKLLAKGYARAQKDGVTVQSVRDLSVGDTLQLFFKDGKVDASVKDVSPRKGENRGV